MNNKVKQIIWCVIILIIVMFLTIMFVKYINNDESSVDSLNQKLNEEISYLDTKLIAMINKTNGISLENYIVTAEEINKQTASESNESQSKSDSSDDSSGGESGGTSQEGENSSNSNNQGTGGEDSTKNVKYKMEDNEILLQDKTPDWDNVKSEIEKLYSSWSTIVLDLYKANVNGQEILSFNSDLDTATQAIKNEDKTKALNSLSKLYSYIPKYVGSVSNDVVTNSVYKTKSNILNAYAAVEQDNFIEVQKQLQEAEQSFLPVINDISSNKSNQSTINKAYILIKETQNSVSMKDKDIFYIKYKNLMQELNNIA